MIKKLQILFVMCIFTTNIIADDLAINFMLMNNYEVKQFDDLWQRMRSGFKLNHTENDLIRYYEKFYTKNPKFFTTILDRAKPYLYFILTELERNGIPSEVALLPIVESSFDPYAITSANSTGLWQFMSFTGNRFNLVQNKTLDERQDIVKSTRAAIIYLKYLHQLFGQWDLALGAYNWGEGNMFKSIQNSGQKLGTVEYNALELRKVTQAYVPKLIALSNIIANPKKFGINLEKFENEPFFAITQAPIEAHITNVVQQSETTQNTFSVLNPQFKNSNYKITPTTKFLLPLENQAIFFANLNKDQNFYNDNSILATNNTENNDPLMQLANDSENNQINNNTPTNDNSDYQITSPIEIAQKKDSSVASNSNADLDDLINNISLNTDNLETKTSYINYIVKAGDTLYSIAKHFNISVSELQKHNQMLENKLIQGSKISIKLIK
ncbi:MAG TPA: transglycosylase SLT domain-containing protein [Burkholderiales bacterium]|nr:transglycosylase SLT domain-containing protein [Burkholderiales bacterium]